MTIDINDYTIRQLQDWAWRVDESGDNQHYGSGTLLVYPDGTIHFMQGGEYGRDGTYAIQPPLDNVRNIAQVFEMQVCLQYLPRPITLESLREMPVRVYDKETHEELFILAKRSADMTVEESVVLDRYINRQELK